MGCRTQRYGPRATIPAPFGSGSGVNDSPSSRPVQITPAAPATTNTSPNGSDKKSVGPGNNAVTATHKNNSPCTATYQRPAVMLHRLCQQKKSLLSRCIATQTWL